MRRWQAQENTSGSWDVVEFYHTSENHEEARFIAIAQPKDDVHRIAAVNELEAALSDLDAAINAVRREIGTQFPELAEAWFRGRAALAKHARAEGSDG